MYFNDNSSDKLSPLLHDIIAMYSKYKRPILSLTELNVNKYKEIEKVNKYCKIHIFSFHTRNFEKNLDYLTNKNNLKVKIIYAPNVMIKSSKAGAIVYLSQES